MPAIALTLAVAVGCGAAAARAKPLADPAPLHSLPAQARPKMPDAAAGTYWQPVEAPVVASTAEPTDDLPLAAVDLARSAAEGQRWDDAPEAVREAVLTRGFAVVRPAQPATRLGAFYAGLADDHIPCVVTLDALFFLAHLAFDRALAAVDAAVIAPGVAAMLHRMDARLAAEGRGAPADVAAGYAEARRVTSVGLSLLDPRYAVDPALARTTAAETALARAHAGAARSPALGVTIDYAAMTPAGVIPDDDAQLGSFRAVAWLEHAWLALEGGGERGARLPIGVAAARTHARAALLLARAVSDAVDPEAAAAWARVERVSALLIGPSDDVSPRDLAAVAMSSEVDLRKTAWLNDVGLVDRVRHRAARGRAVPAFRVLGLRSTPDSDVLQSLTFPTVGKMDLSDATITWAPYVQAAPVFTARNGMRALPTGLDVAAWLGSADARNALRDSGDDAYEGYDDTLELLRQARPPDGPTSIGRHTTPYLSMLDAIETWLRPSAGDACHPGSVTSAWRKRKADVALAAWTELRHDATALTRVALPPITLGPHDAPGATTPVFVEAHPEAIAKISGFVRQTSRALAAEAGLPANAPALAVLDTVDDLLWTALGAAVYEAADAPLPESLATALAGFPGRFGDLERALADSGAADVPITVAVHVDVAAARVLEEATGRIDEAWMVVREPGTHRTWLALGASIPHDELVQPSAQRLSDLSWRARLQASGDPAPGTLARWYMEP